MKIYYSDINMFVNSNLKGTLLINTDVIQQSFYNILTTPIGSRYRQPLYGSYLPSLLQQQLTDDLVFKARMYALQAIGLWEPRVTVIEEGVTFTKINDYTISGSIPYYVPEYNISNEFNGTFITN